MKHLRWWWCLMGTLVAWSWMVPVSAQTIVIDEDFEDLSIDGTVSGTTVIADQGDGRSALMSLTQGINSQGGYAWFVEPFNLRDNKVEIEFDFYIRSGDSVDPADGMSVIFQFGDDLTAIGDAGGGLGSGNLRSADGSVSYDHVAVAFDIWDNGAVDPETPCDAGNRTCHVEVNQNNDPEGQPSVQTSVDFGVVAPDFIGVGDLLAPIHTRIVFDNGRIEVFFQSDDAPGFLDETQVLGAVLDDFPADANAIVGFAASTGSANAHHEVDDLLVSIDDPTEQVNVTLKLGDGNQGAINCGGVEEVTGDVDGTTYTFIPDSAYGIFLGTDTSVEPNENSFAGYGYDQRAGGNLADSGLLIDMGDKDGALEAVYRTERWNNGPVLYRFDVNDGRFLVNLHYAEVCPTCGVSPTGEATRRETVRVEGEDALLNWSSALAAGNDRGTEPVATTAVDRTVEVDVTDGVLEVLVSDLGLLGTPPENAQINGISYRRIGDATGAPLSGAESFMPAELPDIEETVVIDTDFDDPADFDFCPTGWSCNDATGVWAPKVVTVSGAYGVDIDPRLGLSDQQGNIGAAAIIEEPVLLDAAHGFEAEFTAYLTRDLTNTNMPADGMTFFFIPGDETVLSSVGTAGGGLGYGGISTAGFAFEIDIWQGGGATDPNGLNTFPVGHFGLIVNGNLDSHIQHDFAYDPDASIEDWPISLVRDALDPDNGQFVIGTGDLEAEEAAGMRVRLRLNNGRFEAWVKTINEDPGIGIVMEETKVIDTLLEYGTAGLGEGYFGFSAGTGGAVAWHEVDDVRIVSILNRDVTVARSVEPGTFTDASTPIAVTLAYTVGEGTGPHEVVIAEDVPEGWSVRDPSDGGSLADGVLTFTLSGVSADGEVTYTLVPPGDATANVTLTGTSAVNGRDALPIASTLLRWAPCPFGKGDSEILVERDFDDGAQGECPEGFTCNTNTPGPIGAYSPGITQEEGHWGRLQLTNLTGSLATSVVYNTPVDVSESVLTVEFDAYFSSEGPQPADGLTFMILDATLNDEFALGAGGGSIGYGGLGNNTLAVELDLWDNDGDATNPTDRPGYNVGGYGHISVIRDGVVTPHVQSHLDLDPDLFPTALGGAGWPNFHQELTPGEIPVEEVGYPLHVEVEYNNGNVKVWLSAPETVGEPEFPRTQVLDTAVLFPGAGGDDGPPVLQEVLFGFSAGTGGAVCYQEIDNLVVTLSEGLPCGGGGGTNFLRGDADSSGAINITDGIYVLNFLFLGGPDPTCVDAADADDSSAINITDGIYILNFLFLGGPDPAPPGPEACGPDPTEDELDCQVPADKCL